MTLAFRVRDGLDDAEPLSALQDYIFYLEPEKLESGKGKCPYDPKLDTASALISECSHPTLVLKPKGVTSASGAGSMAPTLYPREETMKLLCLKPAPPSPPQCGPTWQGEGYRPDPSVRRGAETRWYEPPSIPSNGGAVGAGDRFYPEIHSVVHAKARTLLATGFLEEKTSGVCTEGGMRQWSHSMFSDCLSGWERPTRQHQWRVLAQRPAWGVCFWSGHVSGLAKCLGELGECFLGRSPAWGLGSSCCPYPQVG